jgi:hypothetical protein
MSKKKKKTKKNNGTFPIKFLSEPPRHKFADDQVDYGYCVNCQLDKIDVAKLVILGKIRTVEIDCTRCGCKLGYFDMDLEAYRAWDISEVIR